MKTFIILILILAGCAGAYLSRPTEENFKDYVKGIPDAAPVSPVLARQDDKNRPLGGDYAWSDHYLWTTESKDGKVSYAGIFNHWFKCGN